MFLLPQTYWEIENTPQLGEGAFAKKDIPPGTIIGDYLGKLIKSESNNEEDSAFYDMYLNDEISILPDKNNIGIHKINYSCSANCGIFPFMGHTLYFTLRHIFAGEELTVNYFLSPPEKNHTCNDVCYCQSPVCHATLHISAEKEKSVEKFYRRDKKYRIKPQGHLGEFLPRLQHYPKNIPDYSLYDMFGSLDQPVQICGERTFPSVKKIRRMIRQSGRMLYFQNMHVTIFGIMNGLIVSMEKEKIMRRENQHVIMIEQ